MYTTHRDTSWVAGQFEPLRCRKNLSFSHHVETRRQDTRYANDDFAQLVDDIRQHGQLEPITLHEGKVVDGAHRYRACCDLGIEPKTRQWDGRGSLVEYVVSMNARRRHLTPSQAAVVALDILPLLEGEARVRQATSTGGARPQLTQRIAEGDEGEARDKAAAFTARSD